MNDSSIEKAFIELVKENERLIYKVCSMYVSDEFPMADLFQEVIYNLWKSFPKFRSECSESTWMYRIALNTCITGMRKELRRPQHVSILDFEEHLIETESMDSTIREMYKLIYRLKTLERAIILLYLEEKSYQEIADITGLTLNNVAIKLKRIKEKLKKMYSGILFVIIGVSLLIPLFIIHFPVREMWRPVFIVSILVFGIFRSIWVYRKVYDANIQSIKKSLGELKELED